jgi:hypothetical protein
VAREDLALLVGELLAGNPRQHGGHATSAL